MSGEGCVLVSGGTRGLGRAVVEALVGDGRRVAAFGRAADPDLARLAAAHPGRFYAAAADLAEPPTLAAVVRAVERDFGPIDGLVNNAAVAADGVLALAAEAALDRLVRINLTGTLLLTRQVVRRMIVRSRGSVVNVSSVAATRGYAGLAAYAATKAGIEGMTRSLARELGPRGIRVNTVAPGYLATEMSAGLTDEQRAQIVRRTPMGRLGRPADVVGAVLFLLSERADFITGTTVTVDGGLSC